MAGAISGWTSWATSAVKSATEKLDESITKLTVEESKGGGDDLGTVGYIYDFPHTHYTISEEMNKSPSRWIILVIFRTEKAANVYVSSNYF